MSRCFFELLYSAFALSRTERPCLPPFSDHHDQFGGPKKQVPLKNGLLMMHERYKWHGFISKNPSQQSLESFSWSFGSIFLNFEEDSH